MAPSPLPFKGKVILVISYTGYKTQSINITESQATLDVLLQKETESLGEVVVIGYGKQQKKDVTSAISSISGKRAERVTGNKHKRRVAGAYSGYAGYQCRTSARRRHQCAYTGVLIPLHRAPGLFMWLTG